LLPRVHEATLRALAGYVAALDARAIESLVVPAGLGDDAGPLGAVAIGLDALEARG
jgi:fructokinase